MADRPYAYEKNATPAPDKWRVRLGGALLLASLLLIGVVLYQLRAKKGPMPPETAVPANHG